MADDHEVTDRGFKHYRPIETRYGHKLLVYESSGASEPQLWLGIDAEEITNGDPSRILLTFDQAKDLRKRLKVAMKNHYQSADW